MKKNVFFIRDGEIETGIHIGFIPLSKTLYMTSEVQTKSGEIIRVLYKEEFTTLEAAQKYLKTIKGDSKMSETAWNEFLKRIVKEIKFLKQESEEFESSDMKEIIQYDLESLRDEYETMSKKYSEEQGIKNIPTFDELMKSV